MGRTTHGPPSNRCSMNIPRLTQTRASGGGGFAHSPICAVTQQTLSSPPPRSPPAPGNHSRTLCLYRSLPSAHAESPRTTAHSPTGSGPELTTLILGSGPPAALPGQARAQARTQDNRGGPWQELRHTSIHLSSSWGSDPRADSGQPQPSRAASPGCVRGGTQRRWPGLVAATPACDTRDGISSRASTSHQHTGPLQCSKGQGWRPRVRSPSPAPGRAWAEAQGPTPSSAVTADMALGRPRAPSEPHPSNPLGGGGCGVLLGMVEPLGEGHSH